jgi:Ribbon-helix-helix protein, copG family.
MWKIQKGYDSVSKSFRLPAELVDKLDKLAYENNLSLNQLVIQCLNFALENLDTDEKKGDTK